MGGLFSHSHVEKTFKKNQEYISEMNKNKMERWIQMQFQLKQREKAMEIARNRELFLWGFSFYVVAATGIVSKFVRVRRPAVLTPLIPMTFVLAYVGDLGYGSKIHRIHAEAEMIMEHEKFLLDLPNGLPTISSIDAARVELDEERRFHPVHT